MLTNWFSQPAGGPRSPTDDGRVAENDDDTQVVEADQGNGEIFPSTFCASSRRDARRGAVAETATSWAGRLSAVANEPPSPVLSHIISQLRPGADLSRVVLPTFILEPRSMLERITKYVAFSRRFRATLVR